MVTCRVSFIASGESEANATPDFLTLTFVSVPRVGENIDIAGVDWRLEVASVRHIIDASKAATVEIWVKRA